jgi:hypothetical protein
MFSTTKITSFLAAFFALAYAFAAVGAVPLESRKALDVFSPPILYPNAMTTWFAGQSHNVTWYVIPLGGLSPFEGADLGCLYYGLCSGMRPTRRR